MASEPSRFGPYELVRRLGAGGMAETYVAVRRGPGGFEQRVCLKRILSAYESDDEFVRLFLEEARLSARLRHANIAQVVDFGLVEGSHFLALELIDGMDLSALLDAVAGPDEALTSGLVSYLAMELGAALDFAHQAGPDGRVEGVVHRDLSPSNVLVSKAGEVKLTDFGIAKAVNQPGGTRTGIIKGKVPYMAPEYARYGRFDARGDLFALGVLLYECLVGERPFDGVTDLDTIQRIQEGRHTPLQERVPKAPRGLTDAIEALLAPDPDQRYPNAAAFLDALVDVAPPPTARRILGELVRNHAGSGKRKRASKRDARSSLPYAQTQASDKQGTDPGRAATKVPARRAAAASGHESTAGPAPASADRDAEATAVEPASRGAGAGARRDAGTAIQPEAAGDGEAAAPLPDVQPASADAETRTRLPAAAPSGPDTVADPAALRASGADPAGGPQRTRTYGAGADAPEPRAATGDAMPQDAGPSRGGTERLPAPSQSTPAPPDAAPESVAAPPAAEPQPSATQDGAPAPAPVAVPPPERAQPPAGESPGRKATPEGSGPADEAAVEAPPTTDSLPIARPLRSRPVMMLATGAALLLAGTATAAWLASGRTDASKTGAPSPAAAADEPSGASIDAGPDGPMALRAAAASPAAAAAGPDASSSDGGALHAEGSRRRSGDETANGAAAAAGPAAQASPSQSNDESDGAPGPSPSGDPPEPPSPTRAERAGERTGNADRDSPQRARAGRPARERKAKLTIVVVPFGDVWVDGRKVGESPVEVRLSAGTHAVATGEHGPTQRKTVRLEPGSAERVVLRRR